MRVLLLQLDGKMPNLALMRIAHWLHENDHNVTLRQAGNRAAVEPHLDDPKWDKVYASLIFKSTLPLAERCMEIYPDIELGGTGWDLSRTLADVGIPEDGHINMGYWHYPKFKASLGFTQRGCRLTCDFCVVPVKEGKARHSRTIADIWRSDGHPDHAHHPAEIILLDNDFFGGPHWIDRHAELVNGLHGSGRFKVDLTQGINARALNAETATALAQLDYRASNMRDRRLYTAWDNIGHEKPLMRGLELLAKAGVKPDHIMVYCLIGHRDSHADREHRRQQIRAFGARPYPMPYVRTPELVGFQRWVIGAYDKRIPWETWARSRYSPRRLGDRRVSLPLFVAEEPPQPGDLDPEDPEV